MTLIITLTSCEVAYLLFSMLLVAPLFTKRFHHDLGITQLTVRLISTNKRVTITQSWKEGYARDRCGRCNMMYRIIGLIIQLSRSQSQRYPSRPIDSVVLARCPKEEKFTSYSYTQEGIGLCY